MAERRRIWPKVVIAIAVIAGGAYAVVKLDIWQAERRAQQELEVSEEPNDSGSDAVPMRQGVSDDKDPE